MVPIAHRGYVFDNTPEDVEARLCARVVDGQLRKAYGKARTWMNNALFDVPRHPEFVAVP